MQKLVTKKVTKKTVKTVTKSVDSKTNPIVPLAAIIISAIFVGPLLTVYTGYVIAVFLVPAVVSFIVAFTYKDMTGLELTEEMRRSATVITSVLGILLVVFWTMLVPTQTVNEIPQNTFTVYQIVFRSLWVIAGVLVSVFLPLGVTVPKTAVKKK